MRPPPHWNRRRRWGAPRNSAECCSEWSSAPASGGIARSGSERRPVFRWRHSQPASKRVQAGLANGTSYGYASCHDRIECGRGSTESAAGLSGQRTLGIADAGDDDVVDRYQRHAASGFDSEFVRLPGLHWLVDRFALGDPDSRSSRGVRIRGKRPETRPDGLFPGVSMGMPSRGGI
jgi:hypothetical protein